MSKAGKFIEDCTRNCSNELCAVEDRFGKKVVSYHEWLMPEQARAAVGIEREELIEKACEWLNNFYNNETRSYLIHEDIENFKKYMEGE